MKYIFYEPRTGCIYSKKPREKNVYCIQDTPENWEKLSRLEGTAKLTWLEAEDSR
jgi:hypothetical protein